MVKPAKQQSEALSVKELAKRICTLEDEKESLNEDINAVYEEADENGIDKKALRQAIKAKRKEIDADYKHRVNEYLEELDEPKLFA